ncbi:bifunctional folylpolyglutamate synthase/dihydrofolate synthase [Planococcus versutus]|uniref:tetrahydrofolate synthase n=1 Tax=Planococcus versutus TaxID=1302659 RepID=A0A1B1RXJ1_9BACL|nr:folylpolyglutamate synthase/dihydrofolate synthase family protein [Planococcus versutus]ANU25655.1 bifunctional folylpolyglutamate synthase/dihydrofolate synthase [Planococcus versutus]
MIIGLEHYKSKWNIHTDSAIHPGLEAITAALEEFGNPHKVGKFIHLAGTNGKGSTATFLSAILRAHGYRVGTFYSPCIEDLHDQIQVDGKPISSQELNVVMKQLSCLQTPVTDFELLTLVAFIVFENHALDFILIEAGMGGALDSTNVIDSEIAIIPSISIDHTNFLGETIEKIAWHKAGIIKKWKPVVIGNLPEEALKLVQQTADNLHAEVIQPKKQLTVPLKLKGSHQLGNATLALEAAKELISKEFDEEKSLNALSSATLAYRFEEIFPGVIFDGAHNQAGAEALVKTVQETFPDRPVHIVMGILKGKDYKNVLRQLETISDHFTFVDFDDDRALSSKILFSENRSKRKTILKSYDILPVYNKEEVTIVTGSLYLLTLLNDAEKLFFSLYRV